MCNTNDTSKNVVYTISKHAKERYAERILNKETNNEIQSYILQNEEKIHDDIIKMITYGTMIYSGKQSTKDNRTNTVDVFSQGCWIILVDKVNKTVITLYKVDLGCGDDFNTEYISRMISKIDAANNEVQFITENNKLETKNYKDIIESNINQINEYRTFIKNLEQANEGMKQLIDSNIVHIDEANKKLRDVVNTLIGKKEF